MNIFDAKSTNSYLNSRIQMLPKRGRGEASRIAKYLSISSTMISQIISGERVLTIEQAERVTDYWSLRPLESDYFIYLIQWERSGTSQLKQYWKTKLEKVKSESKVIANRIDPKKILSEAEKAIFYSSPIYSSVHLYTSTSEKGRTIEEITERFEISRTKVAKLTGFLIDTGLIEEKNGRFKIGAQSTHLESNSPHLIKHHGNWRMKAMQDADDLTESEMMFTSPVSLSKEDFDKLREKMVLFVKDFLKEVHASPAEELACFNMDFFWVKK